MTRDEKNQILTLWREGKTITEIGFAVGVNVSDVRAVTDADQRRSHRDIETSRQGAR